jgi:hypothetical protein
MAGEQNLDKSQKELVVLLAALLKVYLKRPCGLGPSALASTAWSHSEHGLEATKV